MRKILKFKLFGNPQIYLEDEPVFFAFSKINALLYYLAVNPVISRDEIAGLLWPNKSEQSARKNLRNTIYQANKVLDAEYIVSPNKSILQLNESLVVQSDVATFMADPENNLDEYQDEFLKGFFLKDSENFDLWSTKMSNFYEQKFMQNCYQKVTKDIAEKNLVDVEKNIRRLISLDEFDERNYQLLMQFYQDQNSNGKVIEVYYELSSILDEELGISPSEHTREIYAKTLEIVNCAKERRKKENEFRFYGRTQEIEQLEANFDSFLRQEHFESVIVRGDQGIGKTALCQLLLNNLHGKIDLISTTCFQAEQKFLLRPWRGILDQLNDLLIAQDIVQPKLWRSLCEQFFPTYADKDSKKLTTEIDAVNINNLSQVVLEALDKLQGKCYPVIYVENLQWMDEASLSLMTSVLLHQDSALFIFPLRTNYQKDVANFINAVGHYNKLMTLDLEPFKCEQVKAFVERQLPNQTFEPELIKRICHESEGNPLFLMEYVKQLRHNLKMDYLPPKIKEELEFSLINTTPFEQKILQMISFFPESAPVPMLKRLMSVCGEELIESTFDLEQQGILAEYVIDGEINLKFNRNKLREFIYAEQAPSRLRVIHGEIAQILESQMSSTDDEELLSKISYHYNLANQELKSLDYELSYLQIALKFQHELFPIYNEGRDNVIDMQPIEFEREFERFKKVGKQMKALEEQYGDSREYQHLLMKYLYLEGRYLINRGNYGQGINNIQRVIVKAKNIHNDRYLVKGYRQMIYYYIQTDNAVDMAHYIELAMEVSIKTNDHESIGVLLRLKGLYNLMIGNLEDAEEFSRESITIFSISNGVKEKYSSNIAAAYDYLAEIQRLKGNYDQAIIFQKKAIRLCEEIGLNNSLAIFYVDMGVSLFAKREYETAMVYLKKANKLYVNLTSPWKRTQLGVYQTLIELDTGNLNAVTDYFIFLDEHFENITNPRDMGLVYFLRAIVKHLLNIKKIQSGPLEKILNQGEEFYYEKAKDNLNQFRDQYELKYLDEVFSE